MRGYDRLHVGERTHAFATDNGDYVVLMVVVGIFEKKMSQATRLC